MPKKKSDVTYTIEYSWVDDSYWDDGSRVTRGKKTCYSLDEVKVVIDHLREGGKLYDDKSISVKKTVVSDLSESDKEELKGYI